MYPLLGATSIEFLRSRSHSDAEQLVLIFPVRAISNEVCKLRKPSNYKYKLQYAIENFSLKLKMCLLCELPGVKTLELVKVAVIIFMESFHLQKWCDNIFFRLPSSNNRFCDYGPSQSSTPVWWRQCCRRLSSPCWKASRGSEWSRHPPSSIHQLWPIWIYILTF